MFMRPATAVVNTQRETLPIPCPACGRQSVQRYRVLSEGGWWTVTKCAQCLHSLQREPGPLLGPLTTAVQSLIPAATPRPRE